MKIESLISSDTGPLTAWLLTKPAEAKLTSLLRILINADPPCPEADAVRIMDVLFEHATDDLVDMSIWHKANSTNTDEYHPLLVALHKNQLVVAKQLVMRGYLGGAALWPVVIIVGNRDFSDWLLQNHSPSLSELGALANQCDNLCVDYQFARKIFQLLLAKVREESLLKARHYAISAILQITIIQCGHSDEDEKDHYKTLVQRCIHIQNEPFQAQALLNEVFWWATIQKINKFFLEELIKCSPNFQANIPNWPDFPNNVTPTLAEKVWQTVVNEKRYFFGDFLLDNQIDCPSTVEIPADFDQTKEEDTQHMAWWLMHRLISIRQQAGDPKATLTEITGLLQIQANIKTTANTTVNFLQQAQQEQKRDKYQKNFDKIQEYLETCPKTPRTLLGALFDAINEDEDEINDNKPYVTLLKKLYDQLSLTLPTQELKQYARRGV